MNIIVMSRQEIEKFTFHTDSVVVSIYTPGYKPATLKLNEHVKAILIQGFHDLDPDALKRSHEWAMEHGVSTIEGEDFEGLMANCMTSEQAGELIDFAEKWKDIEKLYVHCDAGVSRSPAIAIAICRLFQMEESPFRYGKSPNQHVLSTIMAEDRRRTLAAVKAFNEAGDWMKAKERQ